MSFFLFSNFLLFLPELLLITLISFLIFYVTLFIYLFVFCFSSILGVVIGNDSMIAAGSILLPGTEVPTGQLWGGNPGAFMRNLTPEDLTTLHQVR